MKYINELIDHVMVGILSVLVNFMELPWYRQVQT